MGNSKSAVIVKLPVAAAGAAGLVVLFSVPAGYSKSTKYTISILHGKVIAHRSKIPRHGALKFANMTRREEGLVKIPGVREPGRRFMNTLSIMA